MNHEILRAVVWKRGKRRGKKKIQNTKVPPHISHRLEMGSFESLHLPYRDIRKILYASHISFIWPIDFFDFVTMIAIPLSITSRLEPLWVWKSRKSRRSQNASVAVNDRQMAIGSRKTEKRRGTRVMMVTVTWAQLLHDSVARWCQNSPVRPSPYRWRPEKLVHPV